MKIGCSVPILTLNSRVGLEKLLPVLLSVFDDVFIIDGNSTDGTREYARSLGVRVEEQVLDQAPNTFIQDFSVVRERSWSLARHDWIFYVDSDEVPTEELLKKVGSIVAENDTRVVHEFIRKACLPDGRVVEEAFFYPEYCLRLFARSSGVRLRSRPVHERLILPADVRLRRHVEFLLAGWPAPEMFWQKQLKYLALEARATTPSISWAWFLRWGVGYNLGMLFKQAFRALFVFLSARMRRRFSLPWVYTRHLLRYRLFSIHSTYRAWKRTRQSLCVA